MASKLVPFIGIANYAAKVMKAPLEDKEPSLTDADILELMGAEMLYDFGMNDPEQTYGIIKRF